MDRRKFFFQTFAATATVYLGSQALLSCKKDDPVTTITDIIDTAKLDSFKSSVIGATTAAALPAALVTSAPSVVPAATVASLATTNFNAVVQQYKDNSQIPSASATALKANDPFALNSTLAKMAALPTSVTPALATSTYNSGISDPAVKALLPDIKPADSSFYSNNYYQAAIDVQNINNTYLVPILEKIAALRATTKSASVNSASTGELETLMFLYLLMLGWFYNFVQSILNGIKSLLTHQG